MPHHDFIDCFNGCPPPSRDGLVISLVVWHSHRPYFPSSCDFWLPSLYIHSLRWNKQVPSLEFMVCSCYPVCEWCLMVCFPFQIIDPVWHLSKKFQVIVYSDSSFSWAAANLKPHVNMESLYFKWLAFTKNQFHLLLHCLLNQYCEVLLCLFKTDFLLNSEIITVSKFCYIINHSSADNLWRQ